MGHGEFFGAEFSHFGGNQHDENVAGADGLVVLVLQPGGREGVEKILPDDQLEEDAPVLPQLVAAVDKDLKFSAFVFSLGRRGPEYLYRSHFVLAHSPYSAG